MGAQVSLTELKLKRLFLAGLEGDKSAYGEFLMALSVLLRSYISRKVGQFARTGGDVEDIVQEVLIAIHTRRHTYETDLPVTAWIYTIARYKMIDHLRATSHGRLAVSLDDYEVSYSQEDEIDAALTIQEKLKELPDSQRIPVEMTKLRGYSAKDVAERLGITEVAARVNVHRGLKTLSRLLGRKDDTK